MLKSHNHAEGFLYQHFLSGITEKSLNVFYYACSYAKVDYSRFMNTTVFFSKKSKLSSGITENCQKMQLVEYKMSKS